MDHILRLVLHGCNLTANLQSNLSYLTQQPNTLLNSCDEIVRVFNQSIYRLIAENPSSQLGESSRSRQPDFGRGRGEIDPFQVQSLAGMNPFEFDVPGSIRPEFGFRIPAPQSGVVVNEHISSRGAVALTLAEGEFPAMGVSDSGKRPLVDEPWIQRPRKRTARRERSTVWIPVHLTGNPENPPDDGFVWKKCGRKVTLRSRFLRSYYNCKGQGCKAKKTVQQLNHDPNTIEVTYYGDPHTCGTSAAPSAAAPPPKSSQREMVVATQPPPSSTSMHHISLFSSVLEARLEDRGALMGSQVQHQGSTPTETSHLRATREAESPVMDLDNLANYFSNPDSSSNGLDSIFHLPGTTKE